jgi:hypothetical protein
MIFRKELTSVFLKILRVVNRFSPKLKENLPSGNYHTLLRDKPTFVRIIGNIFILRINHAGKIVIFWQ